jgi:hypothetical protein
MGDTTRDNVIAIAPELASVSQEAFDLVLADVKVEAPASIYKSRTEQAQRYLAAHYLTISGASPSFAGSGTSGPLTKKKVGEVEESYGNVSIKDATRYDTTSYGKVFKMVRDQVLVGIRSITP